MANKKHNNIWDTKTIPTRTMGSNWVVGNEGVDAHCTLEMRSRESNWYRRSRWDFFLMALQFFACRQWYCRQCNCSWSTQFLRNNTENFLINSDRESYNCPNIVEEPILQSFFLRQRLVVHPRLSSSNTGLYCEFILLSFRLLKVKMPFYQERPSLDVLTKILIWHLYLDFYSCQLTHCIVIVFTGIFPSIYNIFFSMIPAADPFVILSNTKYSL